MVWRPAGRRAPGPPAPSWLHQQTARRPAVTLTGQATPGRSRRRWRGWQRPQIALSGLKRAGAGHLSDWPARSAVFSALRQPSPTESWAAGCP